MSDAHLPDENRVELTPEQAIALLPEGETVHTFRNPGVGMMLGADWKRAEVEREIRDAERRELAGEIATSMGHGLVVFPKNAQRHGELLFVATRKGA